MSMIHKDCSTIDIKAIAFDFDGTLLNPNKELTPKTLEAVELLKERGISIILATGRSYRAMLPLQQQLKTHTPSINYNGAAVYDVTTGVAIHEVLLEEEIARKIIAYGREYGLHTHGFRHERLLFEVETPEITNYQNHVKFSGTKVDFDSYDSLEMTKMMYISDDKKTIAHIASLLEAEFGQRIQHCYSLSTYYEMTDGSVNKGRALSMVLEEIKVDQAQSMSFGDGHNDLPMLLFSEIGVVMANASEEVRKQTAYTALSNTEDGVAHFLDDFFKLQLFETKL